MKTYIKPETQIVVINTQQHLLQASATGTTVLEEPASPENPTLSRGHGTSLWDDDEEEE
jgi:hypothetical protein